MSRPTRLITSLFLMVASMTSTAENLQIPAYFEVQSVVNKYIEGIRTGDVQLLRNVFDKDARLHGYIMGKFVNGPIDIFLSDVAKNTPPAKSGEPFRATIVSIEVNVDVARATVVEESYFGMNFKDHFHLIKNGQGWVIVDKIFYHEPRTEQ